MLHCVIDVIGAIVVGFIALVAFFVGCIVMYVTVDEVIKKNRRK